MQNGRIRSDGSEPRARPEAGRRSATGRLLAASAAIALIATAASAAGPSVGDPAPAFSLAGSDGKTYTLEGLLAKHRGVVLAWFPKAFTSGCTEELNSLLEAEKPLAGFDVAYFMVSLDGAEQNREFAESVGAGFVLLSDPQKSAAERYGVLAPGGQYARRWTFYIDAAGVVRHVDQDVKTATHGQDVVRKLGELGFPKR
jgi:thioredoxin-dependent peroxiredoxin